MIDYFTANHTFRKDDIAYIKRVPPIEALNPKSTHGTPEAADRVMDLPKVSDLDKWFVQISAS
jgi:hypothetical protein